MYINSIFKFKAFETLLIKQMIILHDVSKSVLKNAPVVVGYLAFQMYLLMIC